MPRKKRKETFHRSLFKIETSLKIGLIVNFTLNVENIISAYFQGYPDLKLKVVATFQTKRNGRIQFKFCFNLFIIY